MPLPAIIVVEPTEEKLLLPTVPQRLAKPPRSTPALDRFGEQVIGKYIPGFEVIGDGIIGLTVEHPAPVAIAQNRAHIAIENHVCLAVPEFNNVITRGHERPTHRLRTTSTDEPYVSPELIDERLDFINRVRIPKNHDGFIVVSERISDNDYDDLKTNHIRTRWEAPDEDWVVEFRDAATSKQFFTFTPSVDEVARLIKRWIDVGAGVIEDADWTQRQE